jgi:lysophospholipase L1-like esterase
MSAPDRSWTVAPTLLWFCACLVVALVVFDHGLQAVADRLTARRGGTAQQVAGPTFAAKPAVVADSGDDDVAAVPPAPPPDAPKGDRTHLGVLEDVCLEGTPAACKRWAMDGFYKAVAASKRGKLGRAVRVSWYGDSVIATDAIPNALRKRLQTELGDGGPGFVFVVPPHRFCAHETVARTNAGGWETHAISTTLSPDKLYGVGGASAETDGGRATIKLISGTVSNVELYYLQQPKGGRATIAADGAEIAHADTRGDAKAPGYAVGTAAGAKKIDITTEGRVRVFGIALENASGAVVDNLGIVSVNVKSFGAHDEAHWTSELAHRSADLVLIMIGANEAEWLSPHDQDTKDYQGRYEKVLAPLHKARPNGSCLVVSPTDQAEAKDGAYPSRPVMPVLIEAQRKAALASGCAFYSTYAWMGGKGSASRWFAKGLVSSDFQHLSHKGADKLADAMFKTLLAGYGRYAAP